MTTPDQNLPNTEQPPGDPHELTTANEEGIAMAPSRGQRLRSGSQRVARSRWTQMVAALLVGVVIGGGVVALVGPDHDGGRGSKMVQSENGGGDRIGHHGRSKQDPGDGHRRGAGHENFERKKNAGNAPAPSPTSEAPTTPANPANGSPSSAAATSAGSTN